jgi:GMP synthase PP-ATPase subunit
MKRLPVIFPLPQNRQAQFAKWAARYVVHRELPSFAHAFLTRTATRIINEVKGISRVVCDARSKPPGTIAWA